LLSLGLLRYVDSGATRGRLTLQYCSATSELEHLDREDELNQKGALIEPDGAS
jgi:hypothetical protein